jgi:hypothetical protein
MYGTISPLMLIAGQGLMQNTGLGINADLSSKINTYKAIGVVNEFATALSDANGVVSNTTLGNMQTFTAGTFPVSTNTIPSSYATTFDPAVAAVIAPDGSTILSPAQVAGNDRFTDVLTAHANNILGNGDLSKFVVQMYTVMAYTVGAGSFIDAATSTNTYLGPTFSNMDDLISGSITSISRATVEFGADLVNTGVLIDLDKLKYYGTPHSLIVKLATRGLLPYIGPELIKQGINPVSLLSKISSTDSDEALPLVIQKKCYEAFKTVIDDKLKDIMQALRINLPMVYQSKAIFDANTTAMITLADLLDTRKLFPTSFRTLTSPYKTGYKAIYLDNNGSVNVLFKNLGKDYYSILPTGLADANVAMRRALQQIKNVQDMSTARLGASVQQVQTNYGLDLINSLDTPLPSSVYSYYTSSFANGSGSNGRYYLSDGIGTPAGITHNDALDQIISTLNNMAADGALDGLYKSGADTGAFTVMINFLNDVYGTPDPGDPGIPTPPTYATIPGGYPGAGSYDNYDDGIAAIIASANSIISNIASSNPTEYASLNSEYSSMSAQMSKELDTLADAGVVFADTPSSKQSIMSMVNNLHTYAIQNEYRGPAELLEKMADTTTQSGQALVGALREGRNIRALNTIGVGMDNIPSTPDTPVDGTGEFETAQYSVSEAIANISTN